MLYFEFLHYGAPQVTINDENDFNPTQGLRSFRAGEILRNVG